jgi:hypothetical protein
MLSFLLFSSAALLAVRAALVARQPASPARGRWQVWETADLPTEEIPRPTHACSGVIH